MKAFYDEKPSKLEAVGNGSSLYRWNIEEVAAPSMMDEATAHTQWSCDEITVWPPLTQDRITEAVISTVYGKNFEQKLVNEYNAAKLSLYGGSATSVEAKAKIQRYKDFLSERNALKEIIDNDCIKLGIV